MGAPAGREAARSGAVTVLVPVKAFHLAKRRLAPALPPAARAQLARSMATLVLRGAHPYPTAVVCDDPTVADWARQHGATVLYAPGRGLNRAVQTGVARLADTGAERIVVAAGDLPFAADLPRLAALPAVRVVPDRRGDGTNVISVPAGTGFRFAYGPGSFARHMAEAHRLGLPVTVVDDSDLSWDVDIPDDLSRLAADVAVLPSC